MKTGCVIMASGRGKRFGSNKLLAELGGKYLIDWILAATEDVFEKRIVVTVSPEIEMLCCERKIPVILHSLPFRNDTIRLGLEYISQGLSGCMFCPADQPFLKKNTIIQLRDSFYNKPENFWRPVSGDNTGTPVIFPEWSFEELFGLPEGKGGNILLKKYPEKVRLLEIEDALELMDIDTQEELAAAKNIISTIY